MAKTNWCVRMMTHRDMEEVLAIEGECFGMHAWEEDDFRKCLLQRNGMGIGMVAEKRKDCRFISGYMIYALHRTRIDLLSFAVGWQWQRTGCGTEMMNKLKGKLFGQRKKISAQIRETNVDAQKFFASQGFKAVSVLKNFYWRSTVPCDDDAYLFEHRAAVQRMQEST